ncbi:hypothetical protein [Lactobacillus sp. S2-2]|uniref:hypothetical protein n=1 Tax=Lactobacillus sp. S2-2 TaxID=2692917 RepID=UPI001F1C607E|nr:hypothetical protein [Lactobacillus sp. S2-2]
MDDQENLTREQYRKGKINIDSEHQPDQINEEKRRELKTKKLKNRLNIIIITLVVLIICVLLFMRFVN